MKPEYHSDQLTVYRVEVTQVVQNARVIVTPPLEEGSAPSAIIVDPGGEAHKIIEIISQVKADVKSIWLTHSHFDHCGGVAAILRSFPVPLYAHPNEFEMRRMIAERARLFGLIGEELEDCPEPSNPLTGEEEIYWGNNKGKVLFVPGHSPGHLAFYFPDCGVIFSGDVLFATSIGRTDLPGGSYQTLLNSIVEKLCNLPDSTLVFSGHGETASLGEIKRFNPFLREFSNRSLVTGS
jgi:hydroxyacylglutathione hydrolase